MLNTHNTSSIKSSIIGWLSSTVGQILVSLFVPIVTFLVLWQGYLFLSRTEAPQIFQVIVAIVWGVGGVALLYVWLLTGLF